MSNSISNYIYQIENTLYCKKKCNLIIDKDDYDVDDSLEIKEDENIIWVKSLLSTIEFEDIRFNIILDYSIDIHCDELNESNNKIIISYEKDDAILDVPLEREELKEQVHYLQRLISGREVFKDIDHLLLKLYKIYAPIASDMDLVHLEILLSQCFRDKNDVTIPSRLGSDPDHPVLQSLKTNIFNSGFLQGLAFENIGKSIKTGLITPQPMEPSIIEKILTGTLVEKEEEDY